MYSLSSKRIHCYTINKTKINFKNRFTIKCEIYNIQYEKKSNLLEDLK